MNRLGSKLIGGFLLLVLMIVVLASYTAYASQRSLQESIGQSSVFVANEMLVNMNMAIYNWIDRLELRAMDQTIQKAVSASNREFDTLVSVATFMAGMDAEWESASNGASLPNVQRLLGNDLSEELQRLYITHYETKLGLRNVAEVVVTNRLGGTLAATRIGARFNYDGEAAWQGAKESGFSVGTVEQDEASGVSVIPVAVAIRDSNGSFIGVLMAKIDAEYLIRNAVITYRKHDTTQVKLTTDDGRLIYSTKAYRFMDDVSQKEYFRGVTAESGSFIATEGGRAALFSYARDTDYLTFPGMAWILLVSHDVNEVLAPSVRLRNSIIIASAVLILAGILVGFLLSRSITRPIIALQRAAAEIARGNLAYVIKTRSRDEIGMLARSFIEMQESLQGIASFAERIAAGDLTEQAVKRSDEDVLGIALENMLKTLRLQIKELMDGANTLATSTSEISASTSQLASNASETAASISEATTTVEEVKQTAQLAAEKANQVSADAQETAELSRSGRQAVQESVASMIRIKDQVESIAESIVRLSDQTRAIGEIIETVNGIADQSNLLAVNAAIEAARAGEHGKSFTVVAHEIRNLAEQSKRATVQVKTILGDIQRATSAAVMATEQGSKAVDGGVRQSSEAGETIQRFATNIEKAAQAASQISVSSQQQQVGMDQMTLAMEHVREASNQNAQSSRQLEVEAQNLHNLGQKLKGLVERYKA
jgi:X-X-X-Leu-X-X-Gly heptad repeat protein